MKNASASGPAPRIAASTMSRAKPVTRERSVSPPTVRMRDSMPLCQWPHAASGGRRTGPWDENLTPLDENLRVMFSAKQTIELWLLFCRFRPGCPTQAAGPGSVPQGAAHRVDNPVLRVRIEIGMHRQADDLGRQTSRYRQPAVGDREIAVRGLPMQRLRIVDRGRDALGLERRGEPIAR